MWNWELITLISTIFMLLVIVHYSFVIYINAIVIQITRYLLYLRCVKCLNSIDW